MNKNGRHLKSEPIRFDRDVFFVYENHAGDFSPAVIILSGLSIISCTAFAYGIHLKQLPEHLNNLPDEAHKKVFLTQKVSTAYIVVSRAFHYHFHFKYIVYEAVRIAGACVSKCIIGNSAFSFSGNLFNASYFMSTVALSSSGPFL